MNKISTLSQLRQQFPALQQRVYGERLLYLDNAATTQKPLSVIELVNRMNSLTNGNIHRAVHHLSAEATELYEGARDTIKEAIGASRREEVIFTSGTTASINIVANGFAKERLKPGDSILISAAEHHSNIVPWQMAAEHSGATIKVLPIDEKGCWRMDLLDNYLDETVKIVSVAHISNVLGVINPIEEIIKKAHALDIPVLIDGAQGVVHSQLNLKNLDADFYAFSAHKLYAPTGVGILYGKYDELERLAPYMGGGDMVESVTFEKTTYAPPPLKFEAGTSNFIGAAALGEAFNFISQIDPTLLEEERKITQYLQEQFREIEGLRVYGESEKRIPLFSFNVEGAHHADLAMIMDKMGVALRSGLMCSEPLMSHFGVNGMVRASFALYNSVEEAELFIAALKRALKIIL